MPLVPPLAASFTVDLVGALDDEALRTFLRPGPGGVEPDRLGAALADPSLTALAARVRAAVPETVAAVVDAARAAGPSEGAIRNAQRHVVEQLFWPLLYWLRPELYEELVAGEPIHPALLDDDLLRGRVVADLGAGAGRFTLHAGRLAGRVIAVDAVPPLLDRLRRRADEAGLHTIDVRRGSMDALPLDSASVDVAVACSSITSVEPWGGAGAIAEAVRIVRPGGLVVVIWPDNPGYFTAHGFTHLTAPGPMAMRFASVADARRLLRAFYPPEAEQWVVDTGRVDVPFEILGVAAPRDACSLIVDGHAQLDALRLVPGRPVPGVEI